MKESKVSPHWSQTMNTRLAGSCCTLYFETLSFSLFLLFLLNFVFLFINKGQIKWKTGQKRRTQKRERERERERERAAQRRSEWNLRSALSSMTRDVTTYQRWKISDFTSFLAVSMHLLTLNSTFANQSYSEFDSTSHRSNEFSLFSNYKWIVLL